MKKDSHYYINATRSLATETLLDNDHTRQDIRGHISDLVSYDRSPKKKVVALISILRHFIFLMNFFIRLLTVVFSISKMFN